MGRPDLDHHEEAERLQQVLRSSHEELAATESGTTTYRTRRAEVFAATTQLLDFEARIPVLMDERRRRISSRVVYVGGAVALTAMLVIGGLVVDGRFSRWYLVPIIVVCLLAGVITLSEPRAQRPGHRSRAVGALILVAGAALVVVAALRVMSAIWLLALLPVLVAALACWLHDGTEVEATK
ncbi:hypothetical protein [Micromonospora sp. NPDC047187]|uniref:hypothetical protein n=1 Tax=Micromonospora sp. NPDC047187 TaxID=3155262 RepID=UPI0033F0B2B3